MKIDIYNNYMDTALQVTVVKNPPENSTGNGLLHAGVFYSYLGSRGAFTQIENDHFVSMVRMSRVPGYEGLFHRSPWKLDERQAHDDYIGLMAGGYFAQYRVTDDVMTHGRKHFWSWNNLFPEKWTARTFFARFPGMITFFKMCNREWTNPIGSFVLALVILNNTRSTRSDSKLRTYAQCMVSRERSWLCSLAADYWIKSTRKRYGTIGKAFVEYFQSDEHPLTLID
jgi:hypothetical protein